MSYRVKLSASFGCYCYSIDTGGANSEYIMNVMSKFITCLSNQTDNIILTYAMCIYIQLFTLIWSSKQAGSHRNISFMTNMSLVWSLCASFQLEMFEDLTRLPWVNCIWYISGAKWKRKSKKIEASHLQEYKQKALHKLFLLGFRVH